MADMITEMRERGLLRDPATLDSSPYATMQALDVSLDLDFSGYGVFTPITVGSSTVFGSANVERNK
jgi:hypothetical protein